MERCDTQHWNVITEHPARKYWIREQNGNMNKRSEARNTSKETEQMPDSPLMEGDQPFSQTVHKRVNNMPLLSIL